MKKLIAIIILISVTFAVKAQEIVRDFVNNQNTTHANEIIYLTFDTNVSVVNDNINKLIGFDALEEEVQNVLREKYVKISDKVKVEEIFNEYKNSLAKELRRFGFTVYQEKYTQGDLTGRINTLNVSQIELEEFSVMDSIEGKYYTDSTVFYKNLTGLRLNVWLEYNYSDTTSRKLLFLSKEITDEFSGYTEDVEGKKYADYIYSPLNPNDAYVLSNTVGNMSARYMYNFLMNEHVKAKTKGNHKYYYSIGEDKKIKYSMYRTDEFEILPIE